MKQCECVMEKIRAARLLVIPERFKTSTFESYLPKNPMQERALALIQRSPGGSFI